MTLDQGNVYVTTAYICRVCKVRIHRYQQGRLADQPVCPSCRDLYHREREIAEAAVDARWLAKLQAEE